MKNILFSLIILMLSSETGLAEVYWLSLYADADEACAGLEAHGLRAAECPERLRSL